MRQLIVIDDPDDERILAFQMRERGLQSRAQRRPGAEPGAFVAEGDLVVERALNAGCQPLAAFVDLHRPPPVCQRIAADIPVYAADVDIRRHGMGLGVPLSIIALFRRPAALDTDMVAAGRRVLALEGVDNPVNVGAVARSAAALGWGDLLLDRTSGDPLARRALRVSMGTTFALRHARAADFVATLMAERRRGALVVALSPASDSTPIEEIRPAPDQHLMLVLGAERTGLSAEALAAASVRAHIPMAMGIDSFNVAAAGAIACYALRP